MLSRVVFVLALSARHVSVISCSHALIPGSVSQSIQYSALFQGFPGIPPCLAMGINLDLNVPVRVSLLEVSLVAYCQMGARERGSVGGAACRLLPNGSEGARECWRCRLSLIAKWERGSEGVLEVSLVASCQICQPTCWLLVHFLSVFGGFARLASQ